MSDALLACPFCRELFDAKETDLCPVCGVVLRPLAELPPSFEMREQLAAEWERTAPGDRPRPWHSWDRGRGALVALSCLGLGCFFAPWVVMTKPELVTLSGFDLTGSRGFWFGGGAVGWFLNLPLVLSRRTIHQMRGVRIVVTSFAGLTACQAALLWGLAPTDSLIPVDYQWGWGFFASAVLSLLGAGSGLRFGGAAPAAISPAGPGAALDPAALDPAATASDPMTERPAGETLH